MSKTALLLMDLQNGIVSRYCNEPDFIWPNATSKSRSARGWYACHFCGRKVQGTISRSEPTQQSLQRTQIRSLPLTDGNPAADIFSDLAPEASDIVVTKRRVSAFSGSDLEVVLRSQEINHIVLAGIATSGVVLSTLREAADMDFAITVLSDCCFDKDEEVHRVLTEKVFPMQSEVTTAKQWKQQLSQAVSVEQLVT